MPRKAAPPGMKRTQRHRLLLQDAHWNFLDILSQAADMSINMVVESLIAEQMDLEIDLTPVPDPAPYGATGAD